MRQDNPGLSQFGVVASRVFFLVSFRARDVAKQHHVCLVPGVGMDVYFWFPINVPRDYGLVSWFSALQNLRGTHLPFSLNYTQCSMKSFAFHSLGLRWWRKH